MMMMATCRLSALAAVLLGLHGCVSTAHAQAVEVGIQAAYLDLEAVGDVGWGLGGRIGYDTGALLTIEGELSMFAAAERTTGRTVLGLAGLKLGGRTRVYGLFGKLRPGFASFDGDFIAPGIVCPAIFPPPQECLARPTNFALDFGSVVELYPSARLVARVDIGTTYVWYEPRGPGRAFRTGNFQLTLGGGYRF